MRNQPSKVIEYGDSDYEDVYDDWVSNGQPDQFDRQGSWGGALYRVRNKNATHPTFYQMASLGATEFDEDSPALHPRHEGWHLLNRNYMRQKFRRHHDGRVSVEKPELPNELEPS
jgi:hypothetical protein